jgi:hypothetical protein
MPILDHIEFDPLRGSSMTRDIATRFRLAIQEEEKAARRRSARADAGTLEQAFHPVMRAAEELQRELQSVPSIKVTVNPDSVWLSLADRDLKVTYDPTLHRFVGGESAHTWVDGEPYSDQHTWDTADACIEALIRLCARYVRMANAIGRPAKPA